MAADDKEFVRLNVVDAAPNATLLLMEIILGAILTYGFVAVLIWILIRVLLG